MGHLMLFLWLEILICCTGIAAEIGTSVTISNNTQATVVDQSNSSTTLHAKTSTVTSWANSTTAAQHTRTSSTTVATHSVPHSISDIIFPTVIPHRPIEPSAILSGQDGLAQVDTNGKSLLGLIGKDGAPQYPPFVGSDEKGAGRGVRTFPWGSRTAENTNPYSSPPNTGVVRKYEFVVERATLAPDGVERNVIVINGQFPGPTIEANWGDDVEVTVVNKITSPEEGTALHWHGLLQKSTPYEDGVPGITQCPIAPGQTFTYRFNADLYGTSWYHGHYSAQYAAGLFGAMIIHGPTHVDYDEDLGPVLLTDYYHREYYDILEEVMGTDLTKVAPYSDNNLINGKGTYDCSLVNTTKCTPNAGYAKFQLESGKKYRLRLINGGAEGVQKFSLDAHSLTVMAYDFVPVVPYSTSIVTLGVGQRADIIVEATGDAGSSYWLRSTISNCSLANQPNGYAMVYYENAETDGRPSSEAWQDTTDICANDDLSTTTPYYSITPPSTPAREISIDLDFAVNATGHLVWTMNNSTFRTCYNDPVLFRAQNPDAGFTYPDEWNVYDLGEAASIRIVVNNLSPAAHPMHIHGHNMYVLSEGVGEWDGTVVNPNNPARRDVQQLRPAVTQSDGTVTPGHMVFQIDGDNPGVWPFHCHIAWHVSGGLYVNLLERPNEIPKIKTPEEVSSLCQAWDAFTGLGPIDQIDSGL